jgi:hypothetical protein
MKSRVNSSKGPLFFSSLIEFYLDFDYYSPANPIFVSPAWHGMAYPD